MRLRTLFLVVSAAVLFLPIHAETRSVVRVEFANPGLTPSNWSLVLYTDGSGHFHADRGTAPAGPVEAIEPISVDRDVQLSEEFAAHVFDTVHHHKDLNEDCESRVPGIKEDQLYGARWRGGLPVQLLQGQRHSGSGGLLCFGCVDPDRRRSPSTFAPARSAWPGQGDAVPGRGFWGWAIAAGVRHPRNS